MRRIIPPRPAHRRNYFFRQFTRKIKLSVFLKAFDGDVCQRQPHRSAPIMSVNSIEIRIVPRKAHAWHDIAAQFLRIKKMIYDSPRTLLRRDFRQKNPKRRRRHHLVEMAVILADVIVEAVLLVPIALIYQRRNLLMLSLPFIRHFIIADKPRKP